ncbi:MAG: hypothetical protein HWN80_04560 [Candidatus Lokiarchaeota archaeon]|nr:hypothetical protein [Candidatus Lokiarchaeota archaeon]
MNAELFYISFLILFGIFIITLAAMGIFLLVKGVKNKMVNIILGSVGFISLPIGFVGNFVFQLGPIFQEAIIIISFILTVIFTNLTFYKNKGFLSKIALCTVILLGIIQLGFFLVSVYGVWTLNLYYLRVALDFPYTFIVFNWLSYSSYTAYRRVKTQEIEPWIKVRYQMLAFFSLIFSFHNIPEFFQPPGTMWGDPSNIESLIVFGCTAILVVIFSLGFSIAWFMPNRLKQFLNRNYQATEEKEFQEKDLLDLIKKELEQKKSS